MTLTALRGRRTSSRGIRSAPRRRLLASSSVVLFLGLAANAPAAPVSLALSQSTAFSILGHWCGGIQEQAFATGFASRTGHPVGDVYMKTSCSGGGRGSHPSTYTAWASVVWDFSGTAVSETTLAAVPTVNPSFSATDAHGDHLYNAQGRAYLSVVPPGVPAGVSAAQVNDQFKVGWTPDPATAMLISSSTVTAAPVGSSAPVLTATASGSATGVLIGPLEPRTTYNITVVSADAAGVSAASTPITATSVPASVAPSAPTHLALQWTAPGQPGDSLAASWAAGASGNSPIDEYQITAAAYDPGGPAPGPYTQTIAASALSAEFVIDDSFDWSVRARAHNAAGWGPWSATLILPAA